MPIAAVLLTATGLAVQAHGLARILPWEVVRHLLDDPGLALCTIEVEGLMVRDVERLLAAIAAGDPAAGPILTGSWPLDRLEIGRLRRHPRRWARTIDLGVLIGDLDAACCRAGLPLPEGDPLREVATIARFLERERGLIEVRQRLLTDHPWIGDAAWLATTGRLAETVVLQGLRRDQVQRRVEPARMPVVELLARPERFHATHVDVQAAMHAILGGEVGWNDRGHLSLRPVAGWHHNVGGVELTLGVGGLHSTDRPAAVDGPLTDLDVASYYPSIIAGDGIAPPQLPDFAGRVGTLMERRLAAKRARDQTASQALKYVINSLYGQLGNSRSGLFSPPDALRVVLTGQLRLLQLIDGILTDGGELISANTDGVVVRGDASRAAAVWERGTGLNLERTPYRRMWRTSVNDYIACGPDGVVVKTKGKFAGGDDEEASRRAAAPIVARAAVEHLVHGRAIAEVVAQASVLTDFTLWRHVRDLSWDGHPVEASVVRWIVGRGGRPIVQSTDERTHATVAAQAILVPDPGTVDIGLVDRSWYVSEAQDLVDKVLGTTQGARQLTLL